MRPRSMHSLWRNNSQHLEDAKCVCAIHASDASCVSHIPAGSIKQLAPEEHTRVSHRLSLSHCTTLLVMFDMSLATPSDL